MIVEQTTLTPAHYEHAKDHAYKMLDQLNSDLLYHGKDHTTQQVVPAVTTLCEAMDIDLEDRLLVGIAAAFHDTGFLRLYNANEPLGVRNLATYMRESDLPYAQKHITDGSLAIQNTNCQRPPTTMHEKILRDADLSYLGDSNPERFIAWTEKLRQEWILFPESPLHVTAQKTSTWVPINLAFFSKHQWFTKAAQHLFTKNKEKNIEAFRQKYKM